MFSGLVNPDGKQVVPSLSDAKQFDGAVKTVVRGPMGTEGNVDVILSRFGVYGAVLWVGKGRERTRLCT